MANDGTVKIGTELDDSGFKSGLSKLGSVASTALKGSVAIIGSVATAATGAAAGLLALESATEEYRIAQGKLNTAFEAAGYGPEVAAQAYTDFYAILGDTDTATEASQLLAKLADSQEDLSTWTRIAAGVNGTFGDSLPIEGLIESANETAKVGEVTGTLADALNWAGINEDDFNEKLSACTDESERNQLIMETLAGTYDDAADAFYRNNEALIASREAQAQMDDALSKLGTAVGNVKTRMTADFLPAISQVTTGLAGMLSGVEGAEQEFSNGIGSLIDSAVARLPEFLDFGAQIIMAILLGIVENIPALIESIPVIAESLVLQFQEMYPVLVDVGGQLLQQLSDGIIFAIPYLIERLPDVILSILDFIDQNLPTILQKGSEFIEQLAFGILDAIPVLVSKLPEVISAFTEFFVKNFPEIVKTGGQLLGKLIVGILGTIPEIYMQLPQVLSAIVDLFRSGFEQIRNVGAYLIEGLWSGISDKVGWLKDKVLGVVDTIKGWFTGSDGFDTHSPSKWSEKIASFVMQGISLGMQNSLSDTKKAINSVISSLKNTISSQTKADIFRDEVGKNFGLGIAEGIDTTKDEAAKAADELAQGVYNTSKEWLDKQVKYSEYSLREQLEVWNAIQDQFIESSQQYADAEEQILDIRHKILQENLDLEEEYQKQLSDLTQDIFDSYNLFEEVPEAQEVAGQDLINNLQNQVNSIESFYAALDELYSRGVGEDLVNEIKNMGVGASDQLNALLSLSDEQLSEYAELYREKQKLANDLAVEELADLRAQTDEEIQKNLDALEGKFEESAPDVGKALTDGIADGIEQGKQSVIESAVSVAKEAISAAKSAISQLIPQASFSISQINSAMSPIYSSTPKFSTENAIEKAAGMISFAQDTHDTELVLEINGREFARAVIPDMRAIDSQSPQIV